MTSPAPWTHALPSLRLVCAASAAVAVALLVPSAASASPLITCSGGVKLDGDRPRTADMDYQFRCDEPITGFAIATNRLVAGFEPEVLVTTGPNGDPVEGESFGCEGSIPGYGFACSGEASARKLVQGEFATSGAGCSRRAAKLLPMLIVSDSDGRVSEPFPLKSPKCPKQKRRNSNANSGGGR